MGPWQQNGSTKDEVLKYLYELESFSEEYKKLLPGSPRHYRSGDSYFTFLRTVDELLEITKTDQAYLDAFSKLDEEGYKAYSERLKGLLDRIKRNLAKEGGIIHYRTMRSEVGRQERIGRETNANRGEEKSRPQKESSWLVIQNVQASPGYYQVQRGETVQGIARRASISEGELKEANPVLTTINKSTGKPYELREGEYLYIPERKSSDLFFMYKPEAGETAGEIAAKFGVSIGQLQMYNEGKVWDWSTKPTEPLRIPRNLVNGQPVNEVSPAGRDFTYAAEDYVPEGYDDGIGKSAINIKVQDNKWLPVGRLSGRLTIGYGTNLEAAYDANGDVASSAYIQVINEHVERNADGYAVLKTDNETVEERKKAAQNKHAKDLYAYYVEHYQTTVTDALRNNDVKLKQHEYDAIRDIEYNGPEMSRIIIEKINTIGKREAMRDFGWRLGKNRSLFKGLWVRRYNQIRLFLDGVYEYVERDDARGPFDSLFNQSHIRALLPPYSELDTIPLGEIKGFTDP